MTMLTLKPFQQAAVDSTVSVFDYMRQVLDDAGADEANRATAIHDNGYLLIEAPTGSGKTLMAGHVVERVSAADRVVWFWYAPFKGVVGQSIDFLRSQFSGLRLRSLTDDRGAIGTQSGDVFVTTWGLVATKVKDRRSVRQVGEQNDSVDGLIVSLREQGFRIGVVVDEAHHTFKGENQAARFFREVVRPEYTILVTATPDDKDLRDLQERMQVRHIHRIGVSRKDAVGPGPAEGLIKRGVKAVAWRVEEGSEALVDFERTALRHGAELHRFIKAELARAGINLTPLMLVQVDSKGGAGTGGGKSVERAKAELLRLGFTESQIATHTADEPDPGLLALANDERREVLIFKMAVALGFDAPRAWTLVSMRATQSEDFGVQLVGRIMRVHRRLQGRVVPDALRYGYVLLADIAAQSGLDAAGQRINRLRTQYATVSPTTVIVHDGERTYVQSAEDGGQLQLAPAPPPGAVYEPPPAVMLDAEGNVDPAQYGLLFAWWAPESMPVALARSLSTPPPRVGTFSYKLRDGVPRWFKTQGLPGEVEVTEAEVAGHFAVAAEQLMEALRAKSPVKVQRRTLEIFTQEVQMSLDYAPPSPTEMQRRAQRALMGCGYLHPKELRRELGRTLHTLLAQRGYEDADNREHLDGVLDSLLSQHPELLNQARRAALAAKAQVYAADDLPASIETEASLDTSLRNVYGCYPDGLTDWERTFGEHLDADDTQTVLWWHRNPVRKPWSVYVMLETGSNFFPDFVVGINGRPTEEHALLVDPKERWETTKELPKLLADHEAYGRVLIVAKHPTTRKWAIAGLHEITRERLPLRPFRISELASA